MCFFKDIKKYRKYIIYATKAELKSEVANSYLNWIWWLLQPFCMMLVYVFVAVIVFQKSEPFFPVFVFVGQTLWSFFNRTLKKSVGLVRKKKSIVSKVYVPKWVLVGQLLMVNLFKMVISFSIVAILFVIYKVPLSYRILYGFPVVINTVIFTFGLSLIALHIGVFVDDFSNIIEILLKFLFYFTGIFYSINRIPEPYSQILLTINPMAFFIQSLRDCVLYNTDLNWIRMIFWLIIGIALVIVGTKTIYKHENDYVKVI